MQQTELIVAFIRGELTEPQRRDFEQRLLAEPALREKVQDYQIILQGLKGLQYEAFRREVAGWEPEEEIDDDRILIMDFMSGQLSPEAHADFEYRLINEPELARRVEEYRTLAEGFKAMRQQDFEAEVRTWSKDLPSGKEEDRARVVSLKRKHGIGWWRYAAAAVLLVLLAVAIWRLSPISGSGLDLTAFRQDSYIAPQTAIERGEEATLDMAKTAIGKGDYNEAERVLRSVSSGDSLYVPAQYFLGHTYYKMERYDAAVSAFNESLNASQNESFNQKDFNRDNAAWTRILAHM
ncbi:MAG: hypothetical protein KDD04_11635, partial [Sinomicrobium sp.]|nr:hypothetical protein [Sinomicrobium sp.]